MQFISDFNCFAIDGKLLREKENVPAQESNLGPLV